MELSLPEIGATWPSKMTPKTSLEKVLREVRLAKRRVGTLLGQIQDLMCMGFMHTLLG
jgi:hypothetical protein